MRPKKKKAGPTRPGGSRLPFNNEELEANGWKVTRYERDGKTSFRWTSPEGKKLYSSKEVYNHQKGSERIEAVSSSDDEGSSSGDNDEDFVPNNDDESSEQSATESPVKRLVTVKEIQIPNFVYLGMSHQMLDFIDEINKKYQCKKCVSKGKLVPVYHKEKGLGGAAELTFQCSTCAGTIHYASSMMCIKETKRNAISLASALAFLIWGRGYAGYYNVLKKGLSIQGLSKPAFYNIIEFSYLNVKRILDKSCEDAKDNMKKKEVSIVGSWKKAVTSSDGCWLIRGYHSQCASFVVIDFITNGLLYYGHLCMRGSNGICDSELWEGTSKAAEGHLAYLCFSKAKEEGMSVYVNWQDGDSSSDISFRSVFPDGALSRVMLCGGHVGRAHSNNLKEYKSKRTVEQTFINKYVKEFPDIASVKCHCTTRHSKKCGCLTDDFLSTAKKNHFCVLKQCGNDPSEYAERIMTLGKYHARDIHSWTNAKGQTEECVFHPEIVCSCGSCPKRKGLDQMLVDDEGDKATNEREEEDDDIEYDDGSESSSDEEEQGEAERCEGKRYETRATLACPLHSLLYEIECKRLSKKAAQIIDPVMGRGHSNLPESRFNVLTKFRSKDTNLHQLHYEVSTNLGLLQSNMTWFNKTYGKDYHWEYELYADMGLPMIDGLKEQLCKDNETRRKKLEHHKAAKVKNMRVQRKRNRLEEQKRRRKYSAQQKILHSYGESEENELDEVNDVEKVEMAKKKKQNSNINEITSNVEPPKSAMVRVGGVHKEGGKYCKCGSTSHQRTTHRDCPYNKKNQKQ